MPTDAREEHARRQSNTEKMRAFFLAHPGEWIDARDLECFGRQAWRTRASELRRALHRDGLGTIENRVIRPFTERVVEHVSAKNGRTYSRTERVYAITPPISQYRYVPHETLGRDSTVPSEPIGQGHLRW